MITKVCCKLATNSKFYKCTWFHWAWFICAAIFFNTTSFNCCFQL